MIKYIFLLLLSSNVLAGEWYIGPSIEHTSNYTIKENGYGLNSVFINLKYKHEGMYVAGSIGLHNESRDCPEVCFGNNNLARLIFGYDFKL